MPRPTSRPCPSRPPTFSSEARTSATSGSPPPPSNKRSRSLDSRRNRHRPAMPIASSSASAGDEVLGLGVVEDDRRGGLLGLVLEAGVLGALEADALTLEQREHL